MLRYQFLIFGLCFLIRLPVLYAQPDWTVIPNDFEFNMTVTGVAVIHCVESSDENDIVGAFINGEVRGVQPLNTDINGRKFAYMIIYDNDFNGNGITFKIYDASLDTIYDAQQSVVFIENGIIGNSDDPFILNTDYNLTGIFLTQDSIDETALAGNVVAEILTLNEIQDTVSVVYDFVNDSLGIDNDFFNITDSLLILTEDVNAAVKHNYQVHLAGTTVDGCTIDQVIMLPVTGGFTALYDVDRSNEDIILYPNPANATIHFANDKKIERVKIYNVNGFHVYDYKNLSGANSLDISNLESNLYFVECYVDGGRAIKRLVIQR